jgi:fructosamine-3-kinase
MADRTAIEALLRLGVARLVPLHGGDLSEVVRVDLEDGTRLVAKTGPLAGREARMLQAMAAAGAPVPRVVAASQALLVMEYLPEAPASPAGWASLGTALAGLHGATGASYGWDEDYAFGPAPLPNARTDDWPAFWAERRLLAWPEHLPTDLARRLEALAARLPDRLPRRPPPALLHGDLWSGNVLFMAAGAAMIDPACYHGHAEVDLAMLHLFGRPSPAFWEGYGAAEPGMEERRPVYQLWPALVHLRLFGGGYRGLVERCLSAVGG